MRLRQSKFTREIAEGRKTPESFKSVTGMARHFLPLRIDVVIVDVTFLSPI
jgi:hypothetical protein